MHGDVIASEENPNEIRSHSQIFLLSFFAVGWWAWANGDGKHR